jgi:uncharacterized phage-like protein YoqJ
MIITFCGHKDVYEKDGTLSAKLIKALEQLISEGADQFFLGGYGSFDTLAAKTVNELKKQHPEIHSTLVLPYLDRTFNKDMYDDSTYPPLEEVPRRYAISRRNEWMVDQADVVVAYVDHGWGGAAKTL